MFGVRLIFENWNSMPASRPDSAIAEWEYGDLAADLVPISESEAENLTQAFRARWRRTR